MAGCSACSPAVRHQSCLSFVCDTVHSIACTLVLFTIIAFLSFVMPALLKLLNKDLESLQVVVSKIAVSAQKTPGADKCMSQNDVNCACARCKSDTGSKIISRTPSKTSLNTRSKTTPKSDHETGTEIESKSGRKDEPKPGRVWYKPWKTQSKSDLETDPGRSIKIEPSENTKSKLIDRSTPKQDYTQAGSSRDDEMYPYRTPSADITPLSKSLYKSRIKNEYETVERPNASPDVPSVLGFGRTKKEKKENKKRVKEVKQPT